jgi:nitrogen-specific signal transduction histidine kinase
MLAHELRNPLAPIRNAAQLLGFPNLKEASLTQARQVIQRQVEQIARLLDDLLDIARIVQGKLESKREHASLRHYLGVEPVEARRHRTSTSSYDRTRSHRRLVSPFYSCSSISIWFRNASICATTSILLASVA